ncbi:MAG: hypothetical protein U0136_17570 [Bdellovibrionota bacterium]
MSDTKTELVSISEFLSITLLTEHELLGMLERGELPVETNSRGELRIDISSLTPERLAARGSTHTTPPAEAENPLLEEIIASELVSALDEMIDEALVLAFRWNTEPAKPQKAES